MMCSPLEDLGETITKKQIQPSTTTIYRPSHWEGGRGKGGHGGEIGEDKRGKRGWEMQRPLFEHSLVVVIISMTYWKWRRRPHVWSGGVA